MTNFTKYGVKSKHIRGPTVVLVFKDDMAAERFMAWMGEGRRTKEKDLGWN